MAMWNLVFTTLLLVLIMEIKPPLVFLSSKASVYTKILCEKVNREQKLLELYKSSVKCKKC